MKRMIHWASIALLTLTLGVSAHAERVQVEIVGTVDYSVIQGGASGIRSGDRAVMSFSLDSGNYLNSEYFPTRGYRLDLSSFVLRIAGVDMTLLNPQAGSGDALFVLRDNDPQVDGFFLSLGTDDRVPLGLMIPGLSDPHEVEFGRTFGVTTTLRSLNILDAVGTYGFEHMESFQWSVGAQGNYGLEINYEQMTISAVPEPTIGAMFGLGALVLVAVVRRPARRPRA